jgi:hypothetical protein
VIHERPRFSARLLAVGPVPDLPGALWAGARGTGRRDRVFVRLGRRLGGPLLVILVALALLAAVALPGVIGWLVADWTDGSRVAGVVISYWVAGSLVWLLWNEDTALLVISAVLAFLAAAPVVYVLTLVTRAVQLAFGAAPMDGPGAFFLRNVDGVLLGAALGVGLSLLGAVKKCLAPLGPSGGRPDLYESFRLGLSFRVPLAFLLAGLMDLPATPSARVILGAAWGIVAALGAMVYTATVQKEPVRAAWVQVLVTELIFLLGGLIGVVDGLIDNHETFEQATQLVPAAAVSCAATYVLGVLAAAGLSAAGRRARR